MSQQIQEDLFGISSYQTSRKPVKGQRSSALQMPLFPLANAVKAAMVNLKKGQQYMVEKTRMIVTFIKRSGRTTLWACDGHLYRVSDAVLADASIQTLTAPNG
jgi:hypothetical protein